jgi:hypothetical protein
MRSHAGGSGLLSGRPHARVGHERGRGCSRRMSAYLLAKCPRVSRLKPGRWTQSDVPCVQELPSKRSQAGSSSRLSGAPSGGSEEAAAAAAASAEERAASERLLSERPLRPEDIEFTPGVDGQPLLLGKGAFGEVRRGARARCAACLACAGLKRATRGVSVQPRVAMPCPGVRRASDYGFIHVEQSRSG